MVHFPLKRLLRTKMYHFVAARYIINRLQLEMLPDGPRSSGHGLRLEQLQSTVDARNSINAKNRPK